MRSKARAVLFAAGDYFNKYVPDSPFHTDPILKQLKNAALKKTPPKLKTEHHYTSVHRKTLDLLSVRHARERMDAKAKSMSREGVAEMAKRHKAEREAISPAVGHHYTKPQPDLKAYQEADIAADPRGIHAEYNKAHSILKSQHGGAIKAAKLNNRPQAVIDKIHAHYYGKEGKISTLEKGYRAQLNSNAGFHKGYKAELGTRRANVRSKMAEGLTANREIIQARRKFSGTLPEPYSKKQWGEIKKAKPSPSNVIPITGDRPKVGLKDASPERLKEYSGLIRSAESETSKFIQKKVTRRAGIATTIESRLKEHAQKHILSQYPKSKKPLTTGQLQDRAKEVFSQVHKHVHPLLHGTGSVSGTVPIEGRRLEEAAWNIGLHPKKAAKIRDIYTGLTLHSQTATGQNKIRSQFLKRGTVFEPKSITGNAYPNLKKLGKVGAPAAALGAGAGYLIHRALRRKNGKNGQVETKFSAVSNLLGKVSSSTKRHLVAGAALTGGIAAGDAAVSSVHPDPDKTRAQSAWAGAKRGTLYGSVLAGTEYALRKPLRKILMAVPQKKNNDAARDIAIGGIEGGAGVLATDRLIKRFAPAGSPLRRKVLIGAGVGGLATGTIGYGLNRLLRSRRQNQATQMSNLSNLHHFRSIMRSGRSVFHKGSKLDTNALVRNVGDRVATTVSIKSLKSLPRTRKSGFSEKRVERSNIYRPVLITPGKEVIDGRHRIIRKDRMGRTHVQAIKVTAKDLNAVKFSAGDQPRRYRRPVVAVDRYKKAIKDREINRHESNVLRSTIAGAALSKTLGHKLLPGAIAGAGASAGLIVANRKRKDQFGDSSISVKRAERLPYQAAGLTAAGILGRRLYKKFSARTRLLRFAEKNQDDIPQFLKGRKWQQRSLPRRWEETQTRLGRAGRLVRDVSARATGKPQVDSRGRERTPEWKKPWVAALGGGALFAGAVGLTRGIKSPAWSAGVKSFVRGHPRIAKAHGFYRGTIKESKRLPKDLLKKANDKLSGKAAAKTKAEKSARAVAAMIESRKTARKIEEGQLSSKIRPIRFAETVPDWDIRDARGNSARVYHPGSQKRLRRSKKWHEKKSNRDILSGALIATAAGGGAFGKAAMDHNKEAELARQKAARVAKEPLFKWGAEAAKTAEAAKQPLRKAAAWAKHFNQKLDSLISFEDPVGIKDTLKYLKDRNSPGVDYRAHASRRLGLQRDPSKTSLALVDYLRGRKVAANVSHQTGDAASAAIIAKIRKAL